MNPCEFVSFVLLVVVGWVGYKSFKVNIDFIFEVDLTTLFL